MIRLFRRLKQTITAIYSSPTTSEHLQKIRLYELKIAFCGIIPPLKTLEIGSGAGWQALELSKMGFDVSAVDIPDSNHLNNQIYQVLQYDGHNLPYPDHSFDLIFSSNVLEHIPHIEKFQNELKRVLKPEGQCLHLVPTATWVFWTNISYLLKNLAITPAHGVKARLSLMELYYFSKHYWQNFFEHNGWQITYYGSNKLFYTGASFFDSSLSIKKRARLSTILGNSCHVFKLKRA